jgi:hypothetical protein
MLSSDHLKQKFQNNLPEKYIYKKCRKIEFSTCITDLSKHRAFNFCCVNCFGDLFDGFAPNPPPPKKIAFLDTPNDIGGAA